MKHYDATTLEQYRQTLARHAAKQGLIMNTEAATVEPLLAGLLTNGERYGLRTCPCRPATGQRAKDADIVCPCAYARSDVEQHGACYCELFVSPRWQRDPASRYRVPERRPREKILDV